MISANGGLPAHRYTPQVTPRWPRGSEPASISWMHSQAHARQAPTMKDIKEHAEHMAKAPLCGAKSRASCKIGKMWWALFKNRHKRFFERKPQLVESQRATTDLTEEG